MKAFVWHLHFGGYKSLYFQLKSIILKVWMMSSVYNNKIISLLSFFLLYVQLILTSDMAENMTYRETTKRKEDSNLEVPGTKEYSWGDIACRDWG